MLCNKNSGCLYTIIRYFFDPNKSTKSHKNKQAISLLTLAHHEEATSYK